MPKPRNPTAKSGALVAHDNDLRVLQAVRHFGHLRRSEIGAAVWPKSSRATGYVMAGRTVARLEKAGMLLRKVNTLAGASFVLGAKGVVHLIKHGLPAQSARNLAFDGPQFFHRTLGTNYLLERARIGDRVYGEYALLRGWAPLTREQTQVRFGKVPDGLILADGLARGLREGLKVVDWVEVESAFKSYAKAKRALELHIGNPQLTSDGGLLLGKLVFVMDSRQSHDRRLLQYIRRFLAENPRIDPAMFMAEVVFARCFVDPPLAWHGVKEMTVLEYFKERGGQVQADKLVTTADIDSDEALTRGLDEEAGFEDDEGPQEPADDGGAQGEPADAPESDTVLPD